VVDNTQLSTVSTRQAIYLGIAFSAKLAMVWFGVALVASIGVGIVSGYGRNDWNVGLAVGSSMLAVLGPTQMILAWQLSLP